GRAGALGEVQDVRREAQEAGRVQEAAGRPAHEATPMLSSLATSSATISSDRRGSSNARSGPTRSTSERTVTPGGWIRAVPQITATGTFRIVAARITPSGT